MSSLAIIMCRPPAPQVEKLHSCERHGPRLKVLKSCSYRSAAGGRGGPKCSPTAHVAFATHHTLRELRVLGKGFRVSIHPCWGAQGLGYCPSQSPFFDGGFSGFPEHSLRFRAWACHPYAASCPLSGEGLASHHLVLELASTLGLLNYSPLCDEIWVYRPACLFGARVFRNKL